MITIRPRPFVRGAFASAALSVAAFSCAACGDGVPTVPEAPQVAVTINGSTANARVAATTARRSQGLKWVTNLGASDGMLFVFADDRQRFFWMEDTPTPLSIAFIDASKKIVLIEDMAANTLTSHGGPQMRYALEVNAGWFAAHGITAGMTATFTLPSNLTIETDP